ncbi:MAG: cardiolipin synthase ClsB [Myxococcales bacterium]|nr:cardiolipin synthase ClsB [Myxococcales bacterium]
MTSPRHPPPGVAPAREPPSVPPASDPPSVAPASEPPSIEFATRREERPKARPDDDEAPPSALAPRWYEVGRNRLRLLRDGEQAFPAMLEAIERAEREILLEMYWVGNDAVGERFRDALAARARAGVRVSVVYDAVGSMGCTPAWWRPLLEGGGRAIEYHSISPLDHRFRLDRVERRDHRKMMVIDGFEGFTGGINLALPWLPGAQGGGGWRDDLVEVRGPASRELRSLFYRTWRKLTGELPPPDVRPLSRKSAAPVWVLASQWGVRRSIHREYLVRIGHARDRVDIANSYFVPDRRVRMALFRAVRRGVRVRVLVPSKSDVPAVQFAVEALFDTLLRHGVEIWAMSGTMLHAKTAIIDDHFTTIGSYNLDERSWRKNLEVNLAIEDSAFARHVRAWFEHDIAHASSPIDLALWRERSLARRGFEWAAYAMRKFW